jgi:hypothetical protein
MLAGLTPVPHPGLKGYYMGYFAAWIISFGYQHATKSIKYQG